MADCMVIQVREEVMDLSNFVTMRIVRPMAMKDLCTDDDGAMGYEVGGGRNECE